MRVFGTDVVQKPAAVRRMITYLPEEAGAYRNLSGWKYLRFMTRFLVGNEADFRKMIDEGAEICGLENVSRTEQRRTAKG